MFKGVIFFVLVLFSGEMFCQLNIDVSATLPGEDIGVIVVTVSGNAYPFTLLLISPDGDVVEQMLSRAGRVRFENLASGEYRIEVTDKLGCLLEEEVTVEETPFQCEGLMAFVSDFKNPSICGDEECCEGCLLSGCSPDGFIELQVLSEFEYEVSWTGPGHYLGSGEYINSVQEGIYIYEVCSLVDPSCCVNGQIGIRACERRRYTGNYKSDSSQGECEIIDSNGARLDSRTVSLSRRQGATSQSVCDGYIELNLSNLNNLLQYNWEGPEGEEYYDLNIYGLCPGKYCLRVKNGCGTQKSFCYDIADCEKSTLSLSLNSITRTCGVFPYGAIDVNVTGGSPPYQFIWSNGFNTEDLFQVPSGQYNLTVYDDEGCSLDGVYTVPDNGQAVLGPVETFSCIQPVYCDGRVDALLDVIIGSKYGIDECNVIYNFALDGSKIQEVITEKDESNSKSTCRCPDIDIYCSLDNRYTGESIRGTEEYVGEFYEGVCVDRICVQRFNGEVVNVSILEYSEPSYYVDLTMECSNSSCNVCYGCGLFATCSRGSTFLGCVELSYCSSLGIKEEVTKSSVDLLDHVVSVNPDLDWKTFPKPALIDSLDMKDILKSTSN